LICIPYGCVILFAPILGIAVDRLGNNMLITTISCSMLVIAHSILVTNKGTNHDIVGDPEQIPIISLILIGLSLTIFNVVSNASNISLLVEEKAFGTAIGINYSI
jgi:hypothetical protein